MKSLVLSIYPKKLTLLCILTLTLASSALMAKEPYSGLPQSDDFRVINLDRAGGGELSRSISLTSTNSTQEATIARYYDKMLDRDPTDDELTVFFQTVEIWGCNADLLGSWVLAIFNMTEFENILPSSSAQPYSRATTLVKRTYKAALARNPDSGGLTYYRNRLLAHTLGEGDFVTDIVGSTEFADGASEWCGE